MQLFPAVLIGGPPHSGKSVLTYSLSRALRERAVAHYVLRAYPDGEGDWANEADQELVRRIRFKDTPSDRWVNTISRDIARRHLPLLVDVGGRPTRDQEAILAQCTHAILLSSAEAELEQGVPAALWWQDLIERYGVTMLANFESRLGQPSCIRARQPVLEGCLCDLHRNTTASGETFSALVDLIAGHFAYSREELRSAHVSAAPFDLVIELNRVAQTIGLKAANPQWQPNHLPRLLEYLPNDAPLALYDRGPNWVYAAVAAHVLTEPFYQFDPRLGWVEPPPLGIGPDLGESPIQADMFTQGDFLRLELSLQGSYLDFAEAADLRLPVVPGSSGLVVSGKLPLWLWTAVARIYANQKWLAVFQPQLGDYAVVVASRDRSRCPIGTRVHSPSGPASGSSSEM
jgi:CRISPR-associated protein Csx3